VGYKHKMASIFSITTFQCDLLLTVMTKHTLSRFL
jgi:hypothetical protein